MRRAAEIIAFLGLSAAVHAGVIAGLSDGQGGQQAQGAGGADRVTLAAAPDSIAAMAARWVQPPQAAISTAMPPMPQMTTSPMLVRPPDMAPTATLPVAPHHAPSDAPAIADTAPPPPAPGNAVAQSPRPAQRPEATGAPASAPQTARLAQGQGGGATGGSATAPTPTAHATSEAQRQNLMAAWGAQILARIERGRPRVNAPGQVTLTLRIARDGTLAALDVAASSGNADLDQAAVSAVRRAGRFPAAPEGLNDASYAFNLPVRFR